MSFFGDLLAGDAANKAAKYNASLMERDAKVTEQNAEQGYKVFQQYDLPRFDYYARKQAGTIKTQTLASGAEFSGSAYAIALENQIMVDTDRDMMQYNAEIRKEAGLNDAIMKRAEAQVERYRGRVAKTASYFKAASSLLTDYKTLSG